MEWAGRRFSLVPVRHVQVGLRFVALAAMVLNCQAVKGLSSVQRGAYKLKASGGVRGLAVSS